MNINKLLKKYSPKELAESMVFPVKLSPMEEKEAAQDLAKARKKSKEQMTPEVMRTMRLLQLRFKMEDYIKSGAYDPEKNFGFYLKSYLQMLGIKNKDFARVIGIEETQLSQLINLHRKPGESIMMRLEIQSNNIIPAIIWYRLLQKSEEHRILYDKELRRRERKHVRDKIKI